MYVFSDDIKRELDAKTADVCKHVSRDDPECLLEEVERFHTVTRENIDVVRYFIKRKEVKLYQKLLESGIKMPLRDHLDDTVWGYLQLAYLLYENAHDSPNQEIQVALLHRLEEVKNEKHVDIDLNAMMGSLLGGGSNGLGGLLNTLTQGGDGISSLMTSIMGQGGDGLKGMLETLGEDTVAPEKLMENMMSQIGIDGDVSSNPEIINDILKDIKDNLKDSGKDVVGLLERTKEMGMKYQDKIKSGELSVEDMMGSLMGVLKNPNALINTMQDLDLNSLPDPKEMLGSLMGAGAVDVDGIMSQVLNGFGDVKKEEDKTPLTEEQIKELEEFYSNLNLK